MPAPRATGYLLAYHLCPSCGRKSKNFNCTFPTPVAKYGRFYLDNPIGFTLLCATR